VPIEELSHNIVVPGRGVVNLDAEKVNRAVMEYDERLRFGYNAQNDDWIIYIKMPRGFEAAYYIEGEPVYPCIGFKNRIPHPDEALARLKTADTMRHGMRIYNKVVDSQAKFRAKAEETANEGIEEAAQRMQHQAKKEGLI
jgi:hypothetical protein